MANSKLLGCESAAALSVLSAAALMPETKVALSRGEASADEDTEIFGDASNPALSWGEALKELPICMKFMIFWHCKQHKMHIAYCF